MYVLHSATPAFGAKSSSPFAMKAESLLRLAGVDFTRVDTMPTKGPRKKLPFLTLPGGAVLSDSWNIQQHLVAHEGLALAAAPLETALRRVIEDSLYFAQMHVRWAYHPHAVRDGLLGEVPAPLRGVVFRLIRKSVRQATWGQGIGRRPEPEMLELVRQDLDALEAALGEGPFLGGTTMSGADLSLHGLLEQLVPVTFDDPLTAAVRARDRLVALHGRVDAALYAD
ncbi:MAG: glutathione S-transferase family protein [Myxococcota bacterium]